MAHEHRWVAPVAGMAAAAVALGVAELVASGTGLSSAPLIAVGSVVIDAVPGPVKDWAISVFGTNDKAALLTGTAVLLAGLAALIGAAARRRLWYGLVGVAALGVVGAVAAVTRPGASPVAVLPSLLGAVAGAGTLAFLLTSPRAGAGRQLAAGTASGQLAVDTNSGQLAVDDARRRFLTASAAAFGVALLGWYGGRLLGERRSVAEARSRLRLPEPASPAPPAPPSEPVPGVSSFVTSNANFYRIDTALEPPRVDPATWRLLVHGRVRQPFTLTFDQLLAMPMVERYTTLTCVSNEVGGDLVGNARWLGVPVRDLLLRAGPLSGADQVVSRSVDGFTAGTPTGVLLDGRDALLAVGMNGEPLPVAHGFPARMVVPGLYGYVSATKWLTELELTSFADFDAYWVRRGWSAQAPIKTQSRIDVPRTGARVRAGTVTVAGVAWAQHRGVSRVEVRVDDGPWQQARLTPVPSADTWRQWWWTWPATAGQHRLSVRATDATGQTQTSTVAPPEPDGATGWHMITVTVD